MHNESAAPVLGTAAHAMLSPLPYGVGVYSVDAAGATKELPLYYDSRKAAQTRGPNVQAGWYVVAVPGQAFELRVSAVQLDFSRVKGNKLKKGHAVDVRIFVDGTNDELFRVYTFGKEIGVPGFLERDEQDEVTGFRKFIFTKATTSEEEGLTPDDGSGAIVVTMYSGKLASETRGYAAIDFITGDSEISEKEAVKTGKSIKVDTNGDKVHAFHLLTEELFIRAPKEVGQFTIFLRERF